MKLYRYIFLGVMIFVLQIQTTWAQSCPDFGDKSLLSRETILSKIQQCQEARNTNTTQTIEDFSCPAGEFTIESNLPMTTERLAYSVGVNLLMNEADKKMKIYMQELEKSRNKDGVAWTDELRTCLGSTKNSPQKNIRDFYKEICSPLYIRDLLNTPEKPIITTIHALPEQSCQNIAAKKEIFWQSLGQIIMTKNINKSYDNDRSEFINRVQWAYARVISKFHTYQKIIFRSAKKITNYIINPVK